MYLHLILRRAWPGVLAVSLLLGGCGQTVGDLGRAPEYAVTEKFMPAAGKRLADWRGAPVSDFALTDDERELRRRAYRFIMPAHKAGFAEWTEAEAVRARIWPDHRRTVEIAAYADDLHDRYRDPAEARYGLIADDASADTALIDPFFALALAVNEADRARVEAFRTARFQPDGEARDVDGRLYENRRVMQWAADALKWRLMSYAYALERARVEVPSRRFPEAYAAVAEMERKVDLLQRSIDRLMAVGAREPMIVKS
ncbi:MAG: hypothetical protein H6883_00905 [Rhodobiaceae bacterium]|nr:hypothetical protein [Rhodobiaceae bacterium]MCC0054676.1 hypothetical protein [Rhodobiaceae bacterium]